MKRFSFLVSKRSLFILICTLIVGALAFAGFTYFSEDYGISQVRVTNVGATTATITWQSEEPMKGEVWYIDGDTSWPLFDKLGGDYKKAFDDRAVEQNVDGEYELFDHLFWERNFHHVTLRNLEPEKEYTFRINGLYKTFTVHDQIFSTTTVAESVDVPQTVVGTVVGQTAETPVVDGIVFIGNEESPYSQSTVLDHTSTFTAEVTAGQDDLSFTAETVQGNGFLDGSFPVSQDFINIGQIGVLKTAFNDGGEVPEDISVSSCTVDGQSGNYCPPITCPDGTPFPEDPCFTVAGGNCQVRYDAACANYQGSSNPSGSTPPPTSPAPSPGGSCPAPGNTKSEWQKCAPASCGEWQCDGPGPLKCFEANRDFYCLTQGSYDALLDQNRGGDGQYCKSDGTCNEGFQCNEQQPYPRCEAPPPPESQPEIPPGDDTPDSSTESEAETGPIDPRIATFDCPAIRCSTADSSGTGYTRVSPTKINNDDGLFCRYPRNTRFGGGFEKVLIDEETLEAGTINTDRFQDLCVDFNYSAGVYEESSQPTTPSKPTTCNVACEINGDTRRSFGINNEEGRSCVYSGGTSVPWSEFSEEEVCRKLYPGVDATPSSEPVFPNPLFSYLNSNNNCTSTDTVPTDPSITRNGVYYTTINCTGNAISIKDGTLDNPNQTPNGNSEQEEAPGTINYQDIAIGELCTKSGENAEEGEPCANSNGICEESNFTTDEIICKSHAGVDDDAQDEEQQNDDVVNYEDMLCTVSCEIFNNNTVSTLNIAGSIRKEANIYYCSDIRFGHPSTRTTASLNNEAFLAYESTEVLLDGIIEDNAVQGPQNVCNEIYTIFPDLNPSVNEALVSRVQIVTDFIDDTRGASTNTSVGSTVAISVGEPSCRAECADNTVITGSYVTEDLNCSFRDFGKKNFSRTPDEVANNPEEICRAVRTQQSSDCPDTINDIMDGGAYEECKIRSTIPEGELDEYYECPDLSLVFCPYSSDDTSLNEIFSPFARVSAQEAPPPVTLNPQELRKGLYQIQIEGYETTEFVVLNDRARMTYFEDTNGDGIRQETEPTLDPTTYEIVLEQKNSIETYSFNAGWNTLTLNIFSENLDKAGKLLNVLRAGGLVVEQISKFDNGEWISFVFDPDTLQTFGNDFTLSPGQSYFIRTRNEGSVILQGQGYQSNVPVSIQPGWNLISVQSQQAYTAASFVDVCNAQRASCIAVSRWDSAASQYQTYEEENGVGFGEDFPLRSQQGYFVRSTVPERITIQP